MTIEERLAQMEELFRKVGTFKNQLSERHTFSRQQMHLLLTLMCKKKTTVGDLAVELGLSPSATTIAINRLVKSGHINRTRDESDRRIVWVELTDAASETISDLKAMRDQILLRMLQQLTPEEQEQFIRIFGKMIAALTFNE